MYRKLPNKILEIHLAAFRKIILIKNLIASSPVYRFWQISSLKFRFEIKKGFV